MFKTESPPDNIYKIGASLKKDVTQKTLLLGPSAASLSKIKDKYRYSIVIKCEDADGLNDILKAFIADASKDENRKYVSVSVDKNPNSLS